jgi:hypothetical protein
MFPVFTRAIRLPLRSLIGSTPWRSSTSVGWPKAPASRSSDAAGSCCPLTRVFSGPTGSLFALEELVGDDDH